MGHVRHQHSANKEFHQVWIQPFHLLNVQRDFPEQTFLYLKSSLFVYYYKAGIQVSFVSFWVDFHFQLFPLELVPFACYNLFE